MLQIYETGLEQQLPRVAKKCVTLCSFKCLQNTLTFYDLVEPIINIMYKAYNKLFSRCKQTWFKIKVTNYELRDKRLLKKYIKDQGKY